MTTLTHQERAERAAKAVHEDLHYLGAKDAHADIIAREMFPRELVEAAKGLLRLVEGEKGIRDRHGEEFAATEIHEARAVLSLYPEPEEETDRER